MGQIPFERHPSASVDDNLEEPSVEVLPARIEWLETLALGDELFEQRFGITVAPGWVGFPAALPLAIDAARRDPESPWGTHLFFDSTDGALIGFGGFKGGPRNGEVEIGYAVAPSRQGRGIATAVVGLLVSRAAAAGVVTVSAHTLASEGPSTTVLRKSGFTRTGVIEDPLHGPTWRWDLTTNRSELERTRGDLL